MLNLIMPPPITAIGEELGRAEFDRFDGAFGGAYLSRPDKIAQAETNKERQTKRVAKNPTLTA
jgi:hypothetical protein